MTKADIHRHATAYAKGGGAPRGSIGYRNRYEHFMAAFNIAYRIGFDEGDAKNDVLNLKDEMERMRFDHKHSMSEMKARIRALTAELKRARRKAGLFA